MKTYYNYSFLLNSDQGKFYIRTISYDLKRAKQMIMKAENCPERAIEFINKTRITI